jgi:hypothetical protein
VAAYYQGIGITICGYRLLVTYLLVLNDNTPLTSRNWFLGFKEYVWWPLICAFGLGHLALSIGTFGLYCTLKFGEEKYYGYGLQGHLMSLRWIEDFFSCSPTPNMDLLDRE